MVQFLVSFAYSLLHNDLLRIDNPKGLLNEIHDKLRLSRPEYLTDRAPESTLLNPRFISSVDVSALYDHPIVGKVRTSPLSRVPSHPKLREKLLKKYRQRKTQHWMLVGS